MSENILNNFKKRETNFKFNPENFVSANYFNDSMIDRMAVEHEIKHKNESWDPIMCGSWNSDGSLLGCGKPRTGVQIFKPFQNFAVTTIPVRRDCFLTDCLFMPKNKNWLTVSSRNHSHVSSSTLNEVEMDQYVKVWDVVKNKILRTYGFRGLVKKLATSSALPNSVWFNVDQRTQNIAEADIRSPSCKTMQLNVVERNTSFLHSRVFDVSPVNEVTIVVGDKDQILFYDRRMVSSASVTHPTKTLDVGSLNGNNSYIVQLKYNPSGNKLLLTNSHRFNIYQYVAAAVRTKLENIFRLVFKDQTIMNTCKTNPTFLGDNHVLFDMFFQNYSVVFNLENLRYVGDLNLFDENNFFSNMCMPNPFYCLIASLSQNNIKLITPTNHNRRL